MVTFPSVIVGGSVGTEGRTLVTDFIAFMAMRAGVEFSAFSADDPEGKDQWVPSALSRFLGEEVVDLADAWGQSRAEASYFKAVGPSALDRPFLLDLAPACNEAFFKAIEQGYFDALPGGVFFVHVMNRRPDSLDGARIALESADRKRLLDRIGAKEILVFNEMSGQIDIGEVRMPVVIMENLEFECWPELRKSHASINDLMMMEPRHYIDFLIDWVRKINMEQAVEASALVRAWAGRTWLSFARAGLRSSASKRVVAA